MVKELYGGAKTAKFGKKVTVLRRRVGEQEEQEEIFTTHQICYNTADVYKNVKGAWDRESEGWRGKEIK
ncbi:hypothetical protein P5673_032073 [Acropora cervicornis]|uniref:Uncharacterized protein n=1 Tax=Acropora cervicornis TaxID=6130 RepID=A0AAD9PS14_ACRCE|nr:hypothetical protein P5673_032073 [Acropora cervicornis]